MSDTASRKYDFEIKAYFMFSQHSLLECIYTKQESLILQG